jgi:hypothetical protein
MGCACLKSNSQREAKSIFVLNNNQNNNNNNNNNNENENDLQRLSKYKKGGIK